MAGIEISYGLPSVEPTVCGPVSAFRGLTLSENCIRMGEYGTAVGIAIAALAWVGYHYAAPRLYQGGLRRGWWS